MYRARPPEGPLEQGDILVGVPRPILGLVGVQLLRGTEGSLEVDQQPDDYAIQREDTAAMSFDVVDAIVLTQSCDAVRKTWILLAPIEPCDLSSKPVPRAKAVQKLATGLGVVGSFYLPNLPPLKWTRRQALLDEAFTLPRDDLAMYVEQHGLVRAGLSSAGIEYLQHRIGLVFGRLARDDYAWRSVEDLGDHVAQLEAQIGSTKGRLARASDEEEKADLEAELELLAAEIDQTKQATSRVSQYVAQSFPAAPAAPQETDEQAAG